MSKTVVIVFIGPSGCGKSTVSEMLHERLPHPSAVISKDYFRCLIHNGKYRFDPKEEFLIRGLFNDRYFTLLHRGHMKYIILDNTHLEDGALDDIFELSKGFDCEKKLFIFDTLSDPSPTSYESTARELRKRHLSEGREMSVERICWQLSRTEDMKRCCKDAVIIKTQDLTCENIADKILTNL